MNNKTGFGLDSYNHLHQNNQYMNDQLFNKIKDVEIIKRTLLRLGYLVFKGKYNLNMGAVRSANRVADAFDDFIYVFYEDGNGCNIFNLYPATTDPGVAHLVQPVFAEAIKGGTAILREGFYRGLWYAGTFNGVPALLPSQKVYVYRDKNRDNVLDMNPATVEYMDAGILVHPASYRKGQVFTTVGRWSAGCQCPQMFEHMEELHRLVALSAQYYGGAKTSYALMNESQIDETIELIRAESLA